MGVRKENEQITESFQLSITLDAMWNNNTLISKGSACSQFYGHNSPINCSDVLSVNKRNEVLAQSFP